MSLVALAADMFQGPGHRRPRAPPFICGHTHPPPSKQRCRQPCNTHQNAANAAAPTLEDRSCLVFSAPVLRMPCTACTAPHLERGRAVAVLVVDGGAQPHQRQHLPGQTRSHTVKRCQLRMVKLRWGCRTTGQAPIMSTSLVMAKTSVWAVVTMHPLIAKVGMSERKIPNGKLVAHPDQLCIQVCQPVRAARMQCTRATWERARSTSLACTQGPALPVAPWPPCQGCHQTEPSCLQEDEEEVDTLHVHCGMSCSCRRLSTPASR